MEVSKNLIDPMNKFYEICRLKTFIQNKLAYWEKRRDVYQIGKYESELKKVDIGIANILSELHDMEQHSF